MEWADKIRAGMNLIADGCRENTSSANCDDCPFIKYCDISHSSLTDKELPENWDYV